MAIEIPGQETDPQAEAKAAQIAAAKAAGGYCHRATGGAIVMAQGPLGQPMPASIMAGVICFGRDGLCQMWDEEREQCLDRSLAKAHIGSLLGKIPGSLS